jgi:hypothetical protein
LKFHIAAVAGVSLLGAVAVALPGTAGGNKYASDTVTQTCKNSTGGDAGTITLVGPLKLWPPNHKFVDEPVTVTDATGDAVVIKISPSFDESALGGDGGAQHDPDWQLAGSDGTTPIEASGTGTATAAMQLRAERSGQGDGRLYTINWTATFDNGATTCDSAASTTDAYMPYTIEVPHDMRGGADWKN